MHMSILKSAGIAAIPWICTTIADFIVGGWLVDHLIARGYDETPVRKTVLVLGMLLGLAVFGATVTTNPVWAIVWISVALSGLAGRAMAAAEGHGRGLSAEWRVFAAQNR